MKRDQNSIQRRWWAVRHLIATLLLPTVAHALTAYKVKDINPGPDGSVPESLTNFDGALFFSAIDKPRPAELRAGQPRLRL